MRSRIVEIENNCYGNELIEEIVAVILDKKIVIMPSDTIYGFLALPEVENEIRTIKKRDEKPFLYLISEYNQLKTLGIDFKNQESILKKYWPGAVTFIMMSDTSKTIGVRMPDWNILRDIVEYSKSPLISTSVNYSGMPPMNNSNEIINAFQGKVDVIVINKKFKANIASTIIDITNNPYKVIRKGSVKLDEVDF